MKSSLWSIIAVVTGIVGFLVGYSVSGYTGARRGGERAAHAVQHETPAPPAPTTQVKAPAAAPARPAAGY